VSRNLYRAARLTNMVGPIVSADRARCPQHGCAPAAGPRGDMEASVAIDQPDVMSDDARLVAALLRVERPQTAWTIGRLAKVDVRYAQQALDRMADRTPDRGDRAYAILRRRDLGSDVYQAIEDSAVT
jgi:hypothetical protein